jgi:hypothetical protein
VYVRLPRLSRSGAHSSPLGMKICARVSLSHRESGTARQRERVGKGGDSHQRVTVFCAW